VISTTVKCVCCKNDCDNFLCQTCRPRFGEYVHCNCSHFFRQHYKALRDAAEMLLAGNSPDDQVRVYWYSPAEHDAMYIGDSTLEKLQSWRWSAARTIIKNYYPHSARQGSQMIMAVVKHISEVDHSLLVPLKSSEPKANCPECKGTGKYVGFNKVEACRTCG